MKKVVGFYSILLGISIIGLWIMLLITGNIPELKTDPIAIYFHLVAELSMGILSLISGLALLKRKKWGYIVFVFSSGLVVYSVINSSGYYGNHSEWIMVAMFMVILVLSSVFTLLIFKEIYNDMIKDNSMNNIDKQKKLN